MVTAIKLLSAFLGVVVGIVAVLTDYKDKDTRRLTRAGKVAIGLMMLSFVVTAGLQYTEIRADARKAESQILTELRKQRELLEAIRGSSLPLAQGFEIHLSFRLDQSSDAAKSELEQLRKEADERNKVCFVRVFNSKGDSSVFVEAPNAIFTFQERSTDNTVVLTLFCLKSHILEASRDFVTFADLANKRVEVMPWFLSGRTPEKLELLSAGMQEIDASGFRPVGVRPGWGDSYSAQLGELK